MKLKQLTVKQSLNKAYRLIKPERADIEKFKSNFKTLLGHINPAESEENMKGHVMDFLKSTWYNPSYHIATKGRTDFVIHTGKDASHPAGVLFETKKPSNNEMVTLSDLNRKAMHEMILYYLKERIEHHNDNIKYLVITNIYEWFVFDAPQFEKLFYKNKFLANNYKAWAAKQKVSTNNDHFYNEIAKPFIASLADEIEFTYFDIRDYQKPLKNNDKENDNKLIPLFKVISPTHLLKLPFVNDSNTLDKGFYNELLYIIGLEEVKEGNKKLIRRRQEGKRIDGSLLENTIVQLETENCLHKVFDRQSYGETESDQLFSIALELCITWVNRVLFLKLLEAQLLKYHRGNGNYRFLNYKTISQYNELYKLFFQVLARKQQERIERVKAKYKQIPYLNSSLFDITALEEQTIRINMLDDAADMPLLNTTVLKDDKNKPIAQRLNTLQYLFDFLNAYDFASEGSEEIQEERKTLINAAVLGLIFEKINGYKDGSIYTPGFITMYMCRQAIRQSVVNKFKEKYRWKVEAFEDLHNYISEDRSAKTIKEYNALINSLTICDPAVGSGHFLVSALNELIAIKSELGILADANGKRLADHIATVENDELLVTDKERNFFTYYVIEANDKIIIPNAEVQRVQETLFHEKQSLIENSLFGVDINPKSVHICRLRLWIELLKNAYYIADGSNSNGELQTLPNIDINIKTGNSLVSRFGLDEDLKTATPYFEKKILEYKKWVVDYKHEADKEKKRGIQQLMLDLKKGFLAKITDRNPVKKKLDKLSNEFLHKYVNEKLFEQNLTTAQKKDKKRLEAEIEKLNKDLELYTQSPIYSNAFEWRFEFPEVLDNEGNFQGFDLMIANPPYIVMIKSTFGDEAVRYVNNTYKTAEYNPNTYTLFAELIIDKLLKKNGQFALIIPNTWLDGKYFIKMRDYLTSINLKEVINLKDAAFDEIVETVILIGNNSTKKKKLSLLYYEEGTFKYLDKQFEFGINPFTRTAQNPIIQKMETDGKRIKDYALVYRGVETRDNSKWLSETKQKGWQKILLGRDINRYKTEYSGTYINFVPKEMKSNANDALYRKPKILMRRTGNSIIANADFDNYLALKNLYLIIPKNEDDVCSILGQLNSSLFAYYHIIKTSGENKAFAQFPGHYVEDLPCKTDNKICNQISVVVKRLLEKKSDNPDYNSRKEETEINDLVFRLYNIAPEEIGVIKQALIKKPTVTETEQND